MSEQLGLEETRISILSEALNRMNASVEYLSQKLREIADELGGLRTTTGYRREIDSLPTRKVKEIFFRGIFDVGDGRRDLVFYVCIPRASASFATSELDAIAAESRDADDFDEKLASAVTARAYAGED
jgi:hypothetical protein